MTADRPKLPKPITLHLSDFARNAIESEAADRGMAPLEMLHLVISKGLRQVISEPSPAVREEAERRAKIPAAAPRFSTGNPLVRASDQALGAAPHRCIHGYVATPVSEALARRLEDILSATDLDEETVWERLLELGADRVEEDPEALERSPAMKKARAMVRMAERACRRARRAVEG